MVQFLADYFAVINTKEDDIPQEWFRPVIPESSSWVKTPGPPVQDPTRSLDRPLKSFEGQIPYSGKEYFKRKSFPRGNWIICYAKRMATFWPMATVFIPFGPINENWWIGLLGKFFQLFLSKRK